MKIAIISDLHVGSTVGLWPEGGTIEGGGTYEPNKFQRWLLRCWNDAVEECQVIGPDAVVLNGDVVQGIHPKDGQIVGATTTAQTMAAFELLKPLRGAAKKMYLIRGTERHDGKGADGIEVLGRMLDVVPAEDGQWSRWELFLKIDEDEVVHFAHHVGATKVSWYEATTPLRDALQFTSELRRAYGPATPNVRAIVRSHRHRYVHVAVPGEIHAVVTPAWQLKTAFGYKVSSASLPHVGWVLLEWDGGNLTVWPRLYQLPRPTVEEVI